MKKITTILICTAMMLCATVCLCSCNKNKDVPDGMQIVRDDAGYIFYAPEEWTVSNDREISCAYVSKLDTTSILFTESITPECTIEEYFATDISKLNTSFKNVIVEKTLEKTNFGDAKKAYKSIYTYDYKEFNFRTMLIYVIHGERFFIFTYTAGTYNKLSETSYYDFYSEKVQAVIDNFKITEKPQSENEVQKPEADAEGFYLSSNKSICGFNLYLPEEYDTDTSTSFVSANLPDGTNINMTELTYTGLYPIDYYDKRKEDLTALGFDIEEINIDRESKTNKLELPNVRWAYSYEYKQTIFDRTNHVYQVILSSGQKYYVFTYMASEENYNLHLDDAMNILNRIEF